MAWERFEGSQLGNVCCSDALVFLLAGFARETTMFARIGLQRLSGNALIWHVNICSCGRGVSSTSLFLALVALDSPRATLTVIPDDAGDV